MSTGSPGVPPTPGTAGPVVSFVRRRPLTAFFLWFFTVGQAFAFVPVLVDVPTRRCSST